MAASPLIFVVRTTPITVSSPDYWHWLWSNHNTSLSLQSSFSYILHHTKSSFSIVAVCSDVKATKGILRVGAVYVENTGFTRWFQFLSAKRRRTCATHRLWWMEYGRMLLLTQLAHIIGQCTLLDEDVNYSCCLRIYGCWQV